MADNQQYGLGDLTIAKRTLRSAQGTESLQLKVWGGMLSIAICKEGEFKPFWSQPLNADKTKLIRQRMQMMAAKSPGSKDPIIFSKWDKEAKKFNPEWNFELQRDEKLIFHIVISWKGSKYDFPFKGPSGIAFGADNMTEADRSQLTFEEWAEWLGFTVPIQLIITNRKREFNGNGGGGGGNRGGNSGGGSSSTDVEGDDYF